MSLSFAKLHGLGNDFIVVDLRQAAEVAWFDDQAVIQALCDRHLGVGADGILAVLPPSAAGAAAYARMRVRNADGSEAEMCGNGLRCVATWLYRSGAPARFVVETGAGALGCEVLDGGSRVQVEMGPPRPLFSPHHAPGPWAAGDRVPTQLSVADTALALTLVSMGNPHAVTFVAADAQAAPLDDAALRRLAEHLGPLIERHPHFPGRTNVEFVRQDSPRSFTTVVWERGCGITQACGTGACAVAVAACLRGDAQPGQFVQVHLPGGSLEICVAEDFGQVWMRGPVVHVFDGALSLPRLG
ncbi:MAG TPA: diaminopimelate epimerase [Pseudomonadota bacterium]|nr:diaminopimelate epimerase [Pseudomonadota bacterium]